MDKRVMQEGLRLGSHLLDLGGRELRTADDRLVPLRRQALQVLLALAERPGHVVGKACLIERVWPGVVVGDDSLVQAVADIRRVLGDHQQRWLRTVARQGYMLVPDPPGDPGSDADAIPALSLAILPPSGAGEVAWARPTAEAMVADLTLAIGQGLTGGRVIAHDALGGYRDRAADPRGIGAALGVRQVLYSTVRADAGQAHLVLVMADAESGQQHWTQRLALDGAVPPDVVAATARAVLVHMHTAAGARAAGRGARSAEDLAMLGWSAFYRGISPATVEEALQYFEQSVSQDARSLRGWGGVCIMNVDRVQLGWADDPQACRRRASQAVAELEQHHPDDTLTLLARAKLATVDGEWTSALLLCDKLVERNPSNPTAYAKRAQVLLALGRFDDCVADAQRAASLTVDDFRAGLWHGMVATAHFMGGRLADAVATARQAQAENACLPVAPLVLAAALEAMGESDEARRVLREQHQRSPGLGRNRVETLFPGRGEAFLLGRQRLVDRLLRIGLA